MWNCCSSRYTPGHQSQTSLPASGTQSETDNKRGSTEEAPPPLRPPTKRKSRIIPTTESYRNLQNRVKHIPSCSVQSLAKSLTRDCPDDLHKVRAFFCWIAANIRYDEGALRRNDIRSQEPDKVLQTKQAVCQGYSQLFLALCRHAHIPCQMVSGLDKGLNYDPEAVFTPDTPTNHAWNIVFVRGEWRPLDVTWGSGHLDDSGRFQRELTEHWFLTDPAEFITDHFPLLDGNVAESEKYQLLKRPYTLEKFAAALRLKPVAYDLGIGVQGLSHSQAIIRVRRDVTITLRASRQPLETVRATLTERGRARSARPNCSHLMTSMDVSGTCQMHVRPPRAGKYLLEVRGKGQDQRENHVSHLLSYLIICTSDFPDPEPFPNKEEPWGLQRPQAIQSGLKPVKNMRFFFQANRQGEVTIIVPLATPKAKAAVLRRTAKGEKEPLNAKPIVTVLTAELSHAENTRLDLAKRTQVEYTKNAAIVSARLPSPGFYLLRVYAGESGASLPHCVDYLLYSSTELTACPPFPEVYTSARRRQVRLLSPRSGHVPAGQSSVYRVKAPKLQVMKVGKETMVRKLGGVWEGEMTPGKWEKKVVISGAEDLQPSYYHVFFEFTVVQTGPQES